MAEHKKIKGKKEKTSDDFRKIKHIIGPIIDKETNRILKSHLLALLAEPVDYINPAIWGAKQHGELDAIQEEIHQHFTAIFESLLQAFNLKRLNDAEQYAIEFLIRELFISKIVYQVERVKSMTGPKFDLSEEETPLLRQVRILASV